MVQKPELTTLIEKIKFATGLKQDQIAERLGYSRSYLSQALGSGGNDKIVQAVKKTFKAELENITKSKVLPKPEDPPTNPPSTPLSILAEALKEIASTDKIREEARLREAENQRQTLELIKAHQAIAGDVSSIELENHPAFLNLMELLAEVGSASGRKWTSKGAAFAELKNRVQDFRTNGSQQKTSAPTSIPDSHLE